MFHDPAAGSHEPGPQTTTAAPSRARLVVLHTPYELADGTVGVLRSEIGAGVVRLAFSVNGVRRRLAGQERDAASAWTREEIVVRRLARRLADVDQVQFLECAVGVYGAAGVHAAAATAALVGTSADAARLRARAQRMAARTAARAQRLRDAELTDDERTVLDGGR